MRFARGLIVLSLLTLAAGCAGPRVLQAFTTDGCSRFPDRSPTGTANWCHCCVAHDLAYWRGGTADQRLAADQQLKACVAVASGNETLAAAMYHGVRVSGGPHTHASFRWGYGWPYEGRYRALSAEEVALADAHEADYRLHNPNLACPR